MTEKLNQSSGKRKFNLPHVFNKNVVILLVIYALVLIYELLVKIFTESFSLYNPYDFEQEFNNLSLITFASGCIVSLVQFRFLQIKTKCITLLSFGESRKTLFRKKLWFPLLAMVLITIGFYVILTSISWDFREHSTDLLDEYLANALIAILPIFVGYTVGAFSSMVCGKTIETLFCGASICALPFSLFNLVDSMFSLFLKGYHSVAWEYWYFSNYTSAEGHDVTTILSLFDPLYTLNLNVFGFDDKDVSTKYWFETPAFYIVKNLIWIVIFIGIIFVVEKYFVRNFQVENCDKKGKSKLVRIISALTPALMIEAVVFNYIYEYCFADAPSSIMIALLIGIVIFAFITAIIIVLLFFKKSKGLLFNLFGIVVSVALTLLVFFISITGCFGYSSYSPDAEKIKSVSINDVTYLIPNYTIDYYGSIDECLSPDINFELKEEIELIKDIQKFIAKDSNYAIKDTFTITYELEDGSVVTRSFTYLSEEACEKIGGLWETETVLNFYKTILNQSPDINSSSSEYAWFEWEKDLIFNNNFKNIGESHYDDEDFDYALDDTTSYMTIADADSLVVIGKDTVATCLTNEDIERDTIEQLKKALYEDYVNLSASQHFRPEKQLGIISLASCSALLENEMFYADEGEEFTAQELLDDWKYSLFKFSVTTDMVNTISVLKKADLYKYFVSNLTVEEAHIIDSQKLLSWMYLPQAFDDVVRTKDGYCLSAMTYCWDYDKNGVYLEDGCGYTKDSDKEYGWYHNDWDFDDGYDELTPIPKADIKKITPEEAEKLREKAFMTYNAGNDCKFLVMKYTDGTANMLVIPN